VWNSSDTQSQAQVSIWSPNLSTSYNRVKLSFLCSQFAAHMYVTFFSNVFKFMRNIPNILISALIINIYFITSVFYCVECLIFFHPCGCEYYVVVGSVVSGFLCEQRLLEPAEAARRRSLPEHRGDGLRHTPQEARKGSVRRAGHRLSTSA